MSASRKTQGICLSCIFHPECSLRRDKAAPVWFCESFECTEREPCKDEQVDLNHCRKDVNPEICDTSLKGLCMNCENRASCSYPRPEGGVWHCSEYK